MRTKLSSIRRCIRGGVIDKDYKEYLLIKELYRCTPSELDKQDFFKTELHFKIIMLERKEEKLNYKRQEQRTRYKNKYK